MKKFLILFFIIFLFSSCGRKQKNIFHFSSEKPALKINKLCLPVVKGLRVTRTEHGNLICWRSVDIIKQIQINEKEKVKVELVGYNVYRLVNAFFVSKKPSNNFLIKDLVFLDKNILEGNLSAQRHCYIVRAVFKIDNKILQGPSSQIIFEK